MSLRAKTWLFFGLVVAGLTAAVLTIVQRGAVRSFATLEVLSMRRNVHRVLRAVDAEAAHLDTTARDWAVWDSSYEFLETGATDFILANLGGSTLRTLDLSLMAFVRLNGEVAWGRVLDVSTGRSAPVPQAITVRLVETLDALRRDQRPLRARGVCAFADEVRLIALRQVQRGDGSGEPLGVLVMGRTLDADLVDHLATILELDLAFARSDAIGAGSDFALVAPTLTSRERIATRLADESTIAGFGLLRDLDGRPAMVVRALQDREITAQGRAIARYMLILLVAAVAVTALAVQLLLERGVISRLAALGDRMLQIGRLGDASARVSVDGHDEVGRLAAGINGMLAALEASETAVRASEERYRAVVEDQVELICRWRPPGEIVFSNRSYARFHAPPGGAGDASGSTASERAPAGLVAGASSLTRDVPTATVVLPHPGPARPRWVQWSSRGLFNAAGALVEVQSVGRDVTREHELQGDLRERTRLAEALRDAQDAFVNVSRSLSGVVWIQAGAPPNVTYVSPAYEHVWGRSCESLYDDASSFLLGVHSDDRELVEGRHDANLPVGAAECELRILRPDASQRWVHLRRFPLGEGSDNKAIYVAEDITERKRIEAQSHQLEEQLRLLARRIDGAREEERRKLATWIHDEIGQGLTALRMNLTWMQQRLRPRSPELRAALGEMDAMIAGNIQAVQRVTAELRPAVLEDLGLLAAMEWAIGQIRRRTELKIEFHHTMGEAEVESGAALALYRIHQEALANVVRHSGASAVVVELAANEGAVTLKVADDGRGIRPEEAAGAAALGILGMRERVLARGGSLVITAGEHGGTVLTATIPAGCRKATV